MVRFVFIMLTLSVNIFCRSWRLQPLLRVIKKAPYSHSPLLSTTAAADAGPLADNIMWKRYNFDLGSRLIEVAEAKDVDVVIDYSIAHKLPEPYGIQVWDGAFLLSRILQNYLEMSPIDRTSRLRKLQVVDLGCGNGLASLFCASHGIAVKALDFNPLTLQLLEMGHKKLLGCAVDPSSIGGVECQLFNMAIETQRLPACDLLLMSDVIYSKELGKLAAIRVAEAMNVHNAAVLLTDPGRSTVAFFLEELKARLGPQSPSRFGKLEFSKVDESLYGVKGQYLCLNDWLHIAKRSIESN